ncbi:LISK family kinase [Brachionus plicatilis]|uniref:LISK family kinase n=1 Tax=Brachionus plicatilis TaxID=10195 RepID=A0A3M7QPD3_BRAPC|nr:LISK family kinase [Brachionus plicatilis]
MLHTIKRRFSKVVRLIDQGSQIIVKRKHYGIDCDSCGIKDIEGDRFCCTICQSHNLCSECFCSNKINKKHEINHPCILITHPENSPTSHSLQTVIKENSNKDFNICCDLCDDEIKGVYIKCNGCYCTFMCLKCSKTHDKDHAQILYKTVRLEKFQFEDIKLQNMLDNGNFGFVYDSILKPYKYHVACKLMNRKIYNRLSFRRFNFAPREANLEEKFLCVDKELEAYIEIFSSNIVKLLGYGRDHTHRLFLVLEFLENGSLEDFLIKKTPAEIPFLLKLKIMLNVATGLRDIHAKNFIHADIKPKNILLDSSYTAKICDLGSMKNGNLDNYDNNTGGLYYLPLEFFMGQYDKRIDIFSYGLIMYHVFSGQRHTYTANNQLNISKLNLIEILFIKNLILKATNINPNERKSINYFKNILQSYVSLAETVMKKFSLDEYPALESDIVFALNNSIVKNVNKELDIKLDPDCSPTSRGQIQDEKVKKKIDRAIQHLAFSNESIEANNDFIFTTKL